MKGRSFVGVGVAISIVLYMTDRFIVTVPDPIYIAIMVLAIILVVTGLFKNRKVVSDSE